MSENRPIGDLLRPEAAEVDEGAGLLFWRYFVDPVVAAADYMRRALLRAFLVVAGPRDRRWLVDRESRVALLGAGSVTVSFLATIWFPLALLMLAPLMLGVAHVLVDVRYLVVRPGLHRRPLIALIGGIAIIVGLVSDHGVRGALFGAAAAVTVARTSFIRRVALLLPVALLFVFASFYPRASDLLFVHLHNLVAVLFFLFWRRRDTRAHWPFLMLFCIAFVTICCAGERFVSSASVLQPWATVYAPFVSGEVALRVVLLFVFTQSVHYAVWLRLIPEEARWSPRPRSFRQSLKSWEEDVGPVFLAGGVLLTLFLLGLALFHGMEASRQIYLRFASFHGQIELLAGAVLWAEGLRP